MTRKTQARDPRLKPALTHPDLVAKQASAPEFSSEAERLLSFAEDEPEFMPVFDHAAVLRQIELLIKRPYYGDQEEFIGGDMPRLSESDQMRLDQLVELYNDSRGGRRKLLFGDDGRAAAIERTKRVCPAFEDVIALIGRATILSQRSGTAIVVPPILLLGPAGVGKTHASKLIASALRTDIHALSCSTNSDAQALVVGHPTSWKAARMGVLTEAVASGKSAQPVVLLDEIDKLNTHSSERPYNVLLNILERENSRSLVDEFLRVPFDLSGVIFIATANDTEALPSFILDRMTVFNIAPPSGKALLAITALIAEDLVAELRGAGDMPGDDILRRAARHNPRRIGKLLRIAFGFAAQDGRNALTIRDVEAAEAVTTGAETPRQFGFVTPASGRRE